VPERRASLAVIAAAMILYGGAHWAQMERPAVAPIWILGLTALAVAPSIVLWLGRPRLAWLVALPAASIVAVGLVTGLWPWRSHGGVYPRAVAGVLDDGAHGWFSAHTPFDAGRFPAVDSDLKLAFFALAAILAWALICRGWALTAVAVGFLLFALPSTVVGLSAGGLRAALFLCLGLGTLYLTGDRLPRSGAAPQAAVLGATAVIAGLVVGGAPGVSKQAFLGWQQWDPLAKPDKLVNVQYVWDQTYKPLHWPKKRTVVMEVHSPVPLYWKATVLTAFNDDHWTQGPESIPLVDQVGGSYLMPPGYLPPNVITADITDSVRISVKVDGLADPHLIGTGQAMRWTLPEDVRSAVGLDGTVTTTTDPGRGATYSETAYTPRPSPTDLASTGTAYPPEVASGITVGGTLFAPFGSRKPPLGTPIPQSYLKAADRVWRASGADKAKSPFGAAFLVEHYLRSTRFTYDLTPGLKKDVPPLVDFMTRRRHGYCQMFSGAMALVLRMHGIPARVAVGFTTGKPPQKAGDPYIVTDRNAHAWVEVFFPGYGWMPFEPTPTRSLTEAYSSSATAFRNITTGAGSLDDSTAKLLQDQEARITNPLGAACQNQPAGPPGLACKNNLSTLFKQSQQVGDHGHGGASAAGTPFASPSGNGQFVRWLFWAALLILIGVILFKVVAARWRYLRRGPRARASAAYHDLATFVGDQGVPVRPGYTFEDLADRVEHTFGVPTTAFARAASRARYAPLGRAGAAEAEMRRELRGVKRGVRQRLSRSERATGAIRLRSALSAASRRE
jgi:transglutaminase-like putative cysteine protease